MAGVISTSPSTSSWWKTTEGAEDVRDYIISVGILLYTADIVPTNVSCVLTPSPFPRPLFHHAMNIQPALNQLIDSLSKDSDFVADAFRK